MSSSIKINKELKVQLDKLQAKITLQTGQKLSQQELLKKLINFTSKNEEKFFNDFILEWKGVSDDEWEELNYEDIATFDKGFQG